MDSDHNKPIPGPSKLDLTLEKELYVLVLEIEKKNNLKNGSTALYWHLKSIIEGHIENG